MPAFAMNEKVYLDYTRDELDRALDQKLHAPDWREMVGVYEQASAVARERLKPVEENYGPETLDFYRAARPDAPLMIMLHGGGWRMMGRRDVAYAASTFLDAGIAYAAPSYGLLPATSVREMAARCRQAVVWAHANAVRLGIDPARIHVGGMSAGGHLAGVLLATDWARLGLRRGAVAGGVLVSGIFDVAALAASTVYGYTALTAEDIAALSPIRRVGEITAPALVAWGDREPPEFARQSEAFLAELRKAGKQCTGLRVEHRTHFQIALDLRDPDSALAKAALGLIL